MENPKHLEIWSYLVIMTDSIRWPDNGDTAEYLVFFSVSEETQKREKWR